MMLGINVNDTSLLTMAVGGAAATVLAYLLHRHSAEDEGNHIENHKHLTDTDYEESAQLAAAAFAVGKAYAWFGGDKAWRQKQLEWFFEINFRQMQKRGNVCRVWYTSWFCC